MGFTTGLLSGITLTTSALYLTLLLHRHNRVNQSYALAQSTAALTSITDPPPLAPPSTERVENAGLVEMAKDRWNRELVNAVKRYSATDWRQVGEEVESRVRGLVRTLRNSLDDAKKEASGEKKESGR